jgi:hypothetical protein
MTSQSSTRANAANSPESSICTRYSVELQEIARLDRSYYRKRSPSLAERAKYHQRQEELERIRLRLYEELDAVRHLSAKWRVPERGN